MPRQAVRLAAVILLLTSGTLSVGYAQTSEEERASQIALEVQRLAENLELWPGFEPMEIPLAVFTGSTTYLFGHSQPPVGFAPVGGEGGPTMKFSGRHPAITANTSVELGGAETATLMAEDHELSSRHYASVALHELFHVFQRLRHPGWTANEGDLPLYPFDDPDLLTGRRVETEAFRRALEADDLPRSQCWARLALNARDRRFGRIEESFRAYERGNEWNEGLAQYIQLHAAGDGTVEIPPNGFPATLLRQRFYSVGPAIGFLLDRFQPGWKHELEADDEQSLDQLLGQALDSQLVDQAACSLTPREMAALEETAFADASVVVQNRSLRRTAFDAYQGPKLILETASGGPLWPQGFDPLNFELVEGGMLHTRFLKLGNDSGQVTMIDSTDADLSALTFAAGDHPLFNGLERAEFIGFYDPQIRSEGLQISITAEGLTLEFQPAALVKEEGVLRVILGELDSE